MARLLGIVAALALGLFAYQNPATVNVYFVRWSWDGIPVWYPITAGILLVLAACLSLTLAARHRWRVAIRQMREAERRYDALVAEHGRAVAELEGETQQLRQQAAVRASLLRTD